MKTSIIALSFSLICSFSFTSCVSTPRNPESWMESKPNACLPTAIAFREGLKRSNIWSQVIIYTWYDKKTGKICSHAITAYMYPPGENTLWTYDLWGSFRVRAYKDNPREIAKKAAEARNNYEEILSVEVLGYKNAPRLPATIVKKQTSRGLHEK